MTDSDLTIGYRAGQEDSEVWKLLRDIVTGYDRYDDTCDYSAHVSLGCKIQAARELLEKRNT